MAGASTRPEPQARQTTESKQTAEEHVTFCNSDMIRGVCPLQVWESGYQFVQSDGVLQ